MPRTVQVGPAADIPTLSLALEDPDVTEIILAPGRYVEHVVIAPRRGPLTLRSSTGSAEDVTITFGLRQGDRDATGMPFVQDCATLTIDADAVTLDALTIENSFDKGTSADLPDSQAIALRTRGTDITLTRCRLLGRQDTVLLDAPSWAAVRRVHLVDCEIVGDVDFLYGRATALIEGGEIRSRGAGYVTAPSTAHENPRGFLLHGVRFTAEPGVEKGSVHLGRPWHPGGKPDALGQALVVHCELGPHIASPPWHEMGGFRWQDARLAEHANTGPGAHGTGPQLTVAPDPATWLETPPSAPVPTATSTGRGARVHVLTDLTSSRISSALDTAGVPCTTHRLSVELLGSSAADPQLDRFLDELRAGEVAILEIAHPRDPADVFTRIPSALRRMLVGLRARGATAVLAVPPTMVSGTEDGLAQALRRLARAEGVLAAEPDADIARSVRRLLGSGATG